jgi:hypothetical protein
VVRDLGNHHGEFAALIVPLPTLVAVAFDPTRQ